MRRPVGRSSGGIRLTLLWIQVALFDDTMAIKQVSWIDPGRESSGISAEVSRNVLTDQILKILPSCLRLCVCWRAGWRHICRCKRGRTDALLPHHACAPFLQFCRKLCTVNLSYSTSARNGNPANGNHLEICLSSPQKNGN